MPCAIVAAHGTAEAKLNCESKLPPEEQSRRAQFKPKVPWQWLLEKDAADKKIPVASRDQGAVVYDVDLFVASPTQIAELKAKNKIVICYFAAGSLQFSPDAVSAKGKTVDCSKRARKYARPEMKKYLDHIAVTVFSFL